MASGTANRHPAAHPGPALTGHRLSFDLHARSGANSRLEEGRHGRTTSPQIALAGHRMRARERLERPEFIEVCRGVAKAFERGDTYITEMIGVAIAKRVWPEDSPEWRAAAEERRVYDYRSKYYAKLVFWDATHAKQTFTMCATNRR